MLIMNNISRNMLSRANPKSKRLSALIDMIDTMHITNGCSGVTSASSCSSGEVGKHHRSRSAFYSSSSRSFCTSISKTEYFQSRPCFRPVSSVPWIVQHQCASEVGSNVFTHQYLCYSTKKSKLRKKSIVQKEESDDDDDDEDTDDEEEVDDWDQEEDEVDDVKKDWKDLKMNVPSMRVDAVLSAGLGTSRKKIEDAFLSGKLRHNGKKVPKKSKQVSEGDILDVVKDDKAVTKDGGLVTVVMRVEVRRVKDEKTPSDKTRVALRRWKHLEIPRTK